MKQWRLQCSAANVEKITRKKLRGLMYLYKYSDVAFLYIVFQLLKFNLGGVADILNIVTYFIY